MNFRFKKIPFLSFLALTILTALLITAIGIYFSPLSLPFFGKDNAVNQVTNSQKNENSESRSRTNSSTEPHSPSNEQSKSERQDTRNGHFSYKMADPEQMMVIASYGTGKYQRFESMHPEAAKALMRMIYAARDDDVWIVPVSGFRTLERQEKLFQRQIERFGSEKKAAEVSAPPGYSEHHTGFAIDLTDGKFPKKDITKDFQNTKAYNWLTENAKRFDYELSFPRDNSQNINYEPWHWRYIGTSRAREIFGKAE